MANTTPRTPPSKSQPDTQRFASQSEYRAGDLSLGRRAVLKDIGSRYLQLPFSTLIHSIFGSPVDTSRIRHQLITEGVVVRAGTNLQLATSVTTLPAQSNVSESVAFQALGTIISGIFDQMPYRNVSFEANPSLIGPLSEGRDTSCPDACIVLGSPAANRTGWFDIVTPFEFRKSKDRSPERGKIIWSLYHIIREDPLRRFAIGITVENTEMRIWYCNRALLAASKPVDFMTQIDDVISLFSLIGAKTRVGLGWDPTVERPVVGGKTQYRCAIGSQHFTRTRLLALFGAGVVVSRSTQVYQAVDDQGKIAAVKDSWRDGDCKLEGAVLDVLKDIREKLGEEEATKAEKYFARVRVHGDVNISGVVDEIPNPIATNHDVEPILSERRHSSSLGHILDSDSLPVGLVRDHHAWNTGILCRVHTRTIFDKVGVRLLNLTNLGEIFNCLHNTLEALRYIHGAGWVHCDVSVANVLRVETDGQPHGRLIDFGSLQKAS